MDQETFNKVILEGPKYNRDVYKTIPSKTRAKAIGVIFQNIVQNPDIQEFLTQNSEDSMYRVALQLHRES